MLGALLTLVGAVGLCLSSQLSVDEPRGLHVAPVNGRPGDVGSASQPDFSHHGGSILLMTGALIVFTMAWVLLSRPKKAWWLVVLAVAASGWLALLEFDSTFRTVYPVGPNGLPDRTAAPIVFGLGTAGTIAAVGASASLVGSLIMVRSAPK
jgi:hypothetical protein